MGRSSALWPIALLLGGGLWISATPYMGVDHDARLYVLMALRHLNPNAYAADPWFAWGSQDDWSFYSPLLAAVLTQFGVAQGALVVTLLQGAFYVVATAVLCRVWLRGPSAMLAFLLAVSLPLFYSPREMLAVSEGFATARGLAVPLSLLALACVRRYPWSATGLHLLAIAMHPIMGLGPLLVSVLVCSSRRSAIALAGFGVAVGGGIFALGAFGQMALIDGDWYHYVAPAVLVFIGPWLQEEWARLLLTFSVLILGALFGSRALRSLYASVALVGMGGIAVSWFATVLPVSLVLQAQFWRTFWLCLVVALMALADLGARHLLRRHAPWRHACLLFVCAFLLLWSLGELSLALGFFGACVVLLAIAPVRKRMSLAEGSLRRKPRWVAVGLALLALMLLPNFLLSLELAATGVGTSGWPQVIEGLLRTGGFGVLGLFLFFLLRRASLEASWLSVLLLAVCVAAFWDARSAIQRDQEARYSVDGRLNPFSARIRRGDVVYWHQQPERVWMELGTAGYASTTHCTGLVFSRERTLLLRDRMLKVAALGMTRQEFEEAFAEGRLRERAYLSARPAGDRNEAVLANYEARVTTSPFGIENMCRDSSLQWVIDTLLIDGMFVDSVQDTLGSVRGRLYLYDCARFR